MAFTLFIWFTGRSVLTLTFPLSVFVLRWPCAVDGSLNSKSQVTNLSHCRSCILLVLGWVHSVHLHDLQEKMWWWQLFRSQSVLMYFVLQILGRPTPCINFCDLHVLWQWPLPSQNQRILYALFLQVLGWPCPNGLTSWWICYSLCLRHKPTELTHSFHSVLVSVSVIMALSTVFHSVNSPNNSPLLTVLLFLFLPYWSFQLYLFMKVSFSLDIILCGWLGLKHRLAN